MKEKGRDQGQSQGALSFSESSGSAAEKHKRVRRGKRREEAEAAKGVLREGWCTRTHIKKEDGVSHHVKSC